MRERESWERPATEIGEKGQIRGEGICRQRGKRKGKKKGKGGT
jgi:hypothetical protein